MAAEAGGGWVAAAALMVAGGIILMLIWKAFSVKINSFSLSLTLFLVARNTKEKLFERLSLLKHMESMNKIGMLLRLPAELYSSTPKGTSLTSMED